MTSVGPNSATANGETEYSKIYIVFVEVEHANTPINATHRIHNTEYIRQMLQIAGFRSILRQTTNVA